MKTIKFAPFLLALPLFAMENTNTTSVPNSPDLIIKNDTNWRIKVDYQKDQEILSRTVEQKEEILLPNAKTIQSVKIKLNGEYLSLANLETLSLGLYASTEHKDAIRQVLETYPLWNVCVTAKPLAVDIKKNLPFFTTEVYSRTIPHTQQVTTLKDAFPRIRQASAEGKIAKDIEAHYVLEVTKGCSMASINEAYQDKKAFLIQLKANVAQDALELLEVAYKILMQECELNTCIAQISYAKSMLNPLMRYLEYYNTAIQGKEQITQELNAQKESFRILIEEKNIL